jgi:hypothetical protein
MATLEMDRSLPPAFVRETVCEIVADPTVCIPKLNAEGLVTASAGWRRACIIITHSVSVICPDI